MNKKYSQEELDQILLSKVVLNFMTDWYIQHMQYSNQ